MGDRTVTSRPNVTSRVKSMTKDWPFFCKVIELILCVVTIGLIVDPFKSLETRPSLDHVGIVYVSICGYILINAIIILCYLIGESQPKKMSMVFSLVGGILCLVSGIVLIHDWHHLHENLIFRYENQYSNQMIAGGIFALMAAIVFVIDAFLTNKND